MESSVKRFPPRVLPRPLRPATVGVFVALVALAPSAHAVPPAQQQWLPLEVGNTWVYRLHIDRSTPDMGQDRSFVHGEQMLRITGARGKAPYPLYTFEDLTTQIETQKVLQGGVGERKRAEIDYSGRGGALLLHGQRAFEGHEGKREPVRYVPPLVVLPPSPEVGKSWEVGEFRNEEMTARLRGTVVGHEGVTAAGQHFERCLKVRYTGELAGKIPTANGPQPVLSGDYTRRLWMKQGVGIVKDVTDVEIKTMHPDHGVVEISVVTTKQLERYAVH
jgi:hypothetical protein